MPDINRHYHCFGCGFDLRTTNYEVKLSPPGQVFYTCPQCKELGFRNSVITIPECFYKVKCNSISGIFKEISWTSTDITAVSSAAST
jgi:hypothetical protein